MAILLVGCTGFLGEALLYKLLKETKHHILLAIRNKENKNISLKVQKASIDELSEHEDFLSMMKKNGECHWQEYTED